MTENLIHRYNTILKSIPEGVCLIAVSKTKPASDIEALYMAGQRHFGENKVQELLQKKAVLPKDILWHHIGHLQSNKVKSIVGEAWLIHGVDSEKLLIEIDKQARLKGLVQQVLLQVFIAQEESKFGLSPDEVMTLCRSGKINTYQNIKVVGLMGMASFTDDTARIEKEFSTLSSIFNEIKNMPENGVESRFLSMGMSGDYKIALEKGANMLRIGSTIFGGR